ncbi:MAG: hypothetical protein BAJALOKI3v1_830005 [Promethearchaeota archaeon]|nr:MAG: hypothetical protein BAJALOKI3v1_830005 [Candidatus Lokiarchaeota archaeon]
MKNFQGEKNREKGNITMSEVEKAVYLYKKGFRPAQAIVSVYGVRYGMDRDAVLKLAAPFGDGVRSTGNVCGAVIGAIMVLGLKYGNSKPSEYSKKENIDEIVNDFIEKFESMNESIKCDELIGCNLSTEEGKNKATQENLLMNKCPKFVNDAAKILEEMLND